MGSLSATDDTPVASFGQLYLEKIVQFRFDIPTHDYADLKALAKRMLPGRHETTQAEPVVSGEATESATGEAPAAEPVPTAEVPESPAVDDEVRQAPADETGSLGWFARFARWVNGPLVRRRARRRARHRRHRDAENARRIEQGLTPTSFEVQDQERAMALLEEQRATRLIDGRYVWESYNAVAELTRPLPRDVKRLLNRLRFTLKLSNDRNLIKSGALSTAAIGKWALVSERWPDLQGAISQDPAALARLEKKSKTEAGFRAEMKNLVPAYANSRDLYKLIQRDPPLGAVAEAVANFRPPKE
jgi:hypothetical protein